MLVRTFGIRIKKIPVLQLHSLFWRSGTEFPVEIIFANITKDKLASYIYIQYVSKCVKFDQISSSVKLITIEIIKINQ